jgi:TolA-binding protein
MENRADLLLDAYFANTLTIEEAKELKNLVAEDPAVAAEFKFQQRVAASLRSRSLSGGIQRNDWKEAIHPPFPAAAKALKVSMWPRIAYAAAATLALLMVAYLFLTPPDIKTVVAENTRDYPNKMAFKSMGAEAETVSPDVIRAFEQYDLKNYRAAAEALTPIAAKFPDRMDYRFYLGVSQVHAGQYEAAAQTLALVAQNESEQKIPALYYLGLACAGKGDKDCARQNLDAYLASPEGITFKKQAKVVLDAL